MKFTKLFSVLLAALCAAPVFARDAGTEVQRDINQQTRIENGLQSGALTTHEAAQLEKKEARIDRAESNALKDGKLTSQEKERITWMKDKASHDIYLQKHDAQLGNPNSASSMRMQADVGRDIRQQQRIENGIQDGTLTKREAGKLEGARAHVSNKQAAAGSDGHVGAYEHARIQHAENRTSRRIHHQRHDMQNRY
jgi:hypothetical protein